MEPVETCEEKTIHPEQVDSVVKDLPPDEMLFDLAELFKIFGDSTRIKILYVLFEAELCVCDIAAVLGMSQSAISHQLRTIKQARLVKTAGKGRRFTIRWQTTM